MQHSILLTAVLSLLLAGPTPARQQVREAAYDPAPDRGPVLESRAGLLMEVLLDADALGGDEIAVVEMTLPAGEPRISGEHRHGTIELFYILEGVLEHVVDGVAHRLEPGDLGVLRPGDPVRHRVVSAAPVRALVIWVPAAELERLAPVFRERGRGSGENGGRLDDR